MVDCKGPLVPPEKGPKNLQNGRCRRSLKERHLLKGGVESRCRGEARLKLSWINQKGTIIPMSRAPSDNLFQLSNTDRFINLNLPNLLLKK